MKFNVEKMMCGGCVNNVKQALEGLDNISHISVDLESKSAEVEGDIDAQQVIDVLTAIGHPTTLADA